MGFSLKNLSDLLHLAMNHDASDIHLKTEETPTLRIGGELTPVQSKIFKREDLDDLLNLITCRTDQSEEIKTTLELDGSFEVKDLCRIRFNAFIYQGKLGIIIRLIKSTIPSPSDLGLFPIISKLSASKNGLFLVTGPTGSGKTTTLASLINHINQNAFKHIITLEDPIEYLYKNAKSRISQREIGHDSKNFDIALRSALRQDPDIIVIGEMRDKSTFSTALQAAETGHAVFATLHTTNAMTSIERILSLFSAEEQAEIKKRLANSLQFIISQRLIPSLTKKRVLLQEIMINNIGIKEAITDVSNLYKISDIIERGHEKNGMGSISFDQHLLSLYQQKKISKEIALENVTSEANFIKKLTIE